MRFANHKEQKWNVRLGHWTELYDGWRRTCQLRLIRTGLCKHQTIPRSLCLHDNVKGEAPWKSPGEKRILGMLPIAHIFVVWGNACQCYTNIFHIVWYLKLVLQAVFMSIITFLSLFHPLKKTEWAYYCHLAVRELSFSDLPRVDLELEASY